MAHKKPENLGDLSLEELQTANAEAMAEGRELAAKGDEMTDEDIARAEELMGLSQEYEARIAEVEGEAQARADRIAALRDGFAEREEDSDADADADNDEQDAGDGDADAQNEADADAEKEVVVASAPKRTVSSAKRKAPPAPAPKVEVIEEEKPSFAIIAAANVPGVSASENLGTMLKTAEAFNARSRGFVAGSTRGDKPQVKDVSVRDAAGNVLTSREFALSDRHQRFGVARVEQEDREFVLEERMSEQDQYDTIMAAAKIARTTRMESLVAGGGWCAPSEIVYGFLELETVSGILDLPTITSKRGGIRYTKGPDYSALAATWGFLQTEAQAIANTTKTCYELTCPTWDEIRLDAVGFCVTAPVLTNAAFPELTSRVLSIGATAHAHKVNAEVISRISTYLGAAINWAEVGGATTSASTSDILDAAALQAVRLRYQYAMDPSTIIEAVFPFWAKEQVRADLGRRLNQDNPLNVSDQQINSFFAVRGIRAQFVYDYQPPIAGALGTGAGTGGWTAFPTKLEFMMFPAGAFTKLTKDVIEMDSIYDSVGLSKNVFTAAFFEEGIAVANTGASGVKVAVDLNTRGSMGFAAVGAGTGVTF